MRFHRTPLAGLLVVEPEVHEDERGSFFRIYCAREFEDQGIRFRPVQSNVSRSAEKGTIRGLHFQEAPHQEAKLVHCTRGSLHVVAVDLRPGSETLARSWATGLSAADGRQLYVPAGMANGFQTLEDDCEILYLMSAFHAPAAAAGYRYDDPTFDIEWPLPVTQISQRDLQLPFFDHDCPPADD